MKKTLLLIAAALPLICHAQKWESPEQRGFRFPEVDFRNHAGHTEGWKIYRAIVPDPAAFIQQHAKWVVETLYWTVTDENIPAIEKITYTFEDKEGISAKGGGVPDIHIFYSSRWVEQSHRNDGADKVLFETRGVLYHELTHGYQAEPRGCGVYRQGDQFWVFIEGVADAVRAINGFFDMSTRKPGGHWMDGYRTTGFFLQWLTIRDMDFLRKFNRSAFDIDPWSFDAAMQSIFGGDVTTESLWDEYQAFLKTI